MSLSCHLSHVPLPPRNWDPFCNVINAGRASKQESIDAENCASDYPPWPSSHPGLKESERESGLWLPTAKWQRSLDPLSRAVRAKPLMKCLALASTFVERLRDCLHSPAHHSNVGGRSASWTSPLLQVYVVRTPQLSLNHLPFVRAYSFFAPPYEVVCLSVRRTLSVRFFSSSSFLLSGGALCTFWWWSCNYTSKSNLFPLKAM